MKIDKVALSGKVHRYHFTLRSELKEEIAWIGAKYGLSLHDTIVFMLKTIYPVMVKYHFTGEEADGKPEKVRWYLIDCIVNKGFQKIPRPGDLDFSFL